MSKYGKKNVGQEDRVVRGVAAGVLGVGGLAAKGALRWVLLGGAAALGTTAALGTCPAYSFLGVNSAA